MEKKWWYVAAVALTIIIIVVPWWWLCAAQTTVLLIRHADRAGTQDALSANGVVRSQELVHVAEKAGLGAIIRSDTVRAQQTAAPLAAATGLVPIVIPAIDTQAVIDEIRNNHAGRKVLVIGHSDTVPQIIVGLGGPAIPEFDGNEFDNLFVLSLCRCRWFVTPLVNLQYGAASP